MMLPKECQVCGSTEGLMHTVMGTFCRKHYEAAKRQAKARYTGKPFRRSEGVAICPYCGYHNEAWEIAEDEWEIQWIQCGRCETTFKMRREVRVYYNTERLKVAKP